MEQAIVSIVGLILAVVLYQERSRRADMAALRRDLNARFTELRGELKGDIGVLRGDMDAGFAALRGELKGDIGVLREEMSRGFARIDNLTASVIALSESVGQVKGRTEVLVTAD